MNSHHYYPKGGARSSSITRSPAAIPAEGVSSPPVPRIALNSHVQPAVSSSNPSSNNRQKNDSASELMMKSIPAPQFFAGLKTREYREHRSSNHSHTSIRSIAWNILGNRIACGLTDKLVRVWNPEKPEIRNSTELKGHSLGVDRVAWDPTHADKLVSCGGDGIVRFWDYRSNKCLGITSTSGENISLAYHPEGSVVAVGTKDDKIHFIDPRNTSQILKTHKEGTQTNQIIFSHSGDTLLLTTGQGHVVLRDWPSLEHVYTVEAHSSGAFCLELDPRGSTLAVGGSDAVVSVWDTKEWICQRTLRNMESPVRNLSISFDGAYICAGSDEPGAVNIDIANLDTGEHVYTVPTSHPVPNVAWHPNKYWLAYSGDPLGLKIVGAAGP